MRNFLLALALGTLFGYISYNFGAHVAITPLAAAYWLHILDRHEDSD